MELGDNPTCRKGAPVQLAWEPFRTSNELVKDRYGCPKYLLPDYRRGILLNIGYSEEVIVAASSRAPEEPDEDEEEAQEYEADLQKEAKKLARRFKLQELKWTKNLNPKNLREMLAKRKEEATDE